MELRGLYNAVSIGHLDQQVVEELTRSDNVKGV